MTRKSILILVALVALLAIGAFTVMAQEGDGTTPPFGRGMMQGRHGAMMGGGFGYGLGLGDGQPMIVTAAEVLGLEPDSLFDALHNGQTLTEIAEAQGVELQSVYDAVLAQAEEHVAALVEAGSITQEQAGEHLAWVGEHLAEMPMLSGAGYGPCMDGEGGFGGGMMGRGMHGRGMRGQGMRGNWS
jgi:hypothetical protein